jgi:hypothetical protein
MEYEDNGEAYDAGDEGEVTVDPETEQLALDLALNKLKEAGWNG